MAAEEYYIDIHMNGQAIKQIADPIEDKDAVNKLYVDRLKFSTGGAYSMTYTQGEASTVWDIVYPDGITGTPEVIVKDSTGQRVYPSIAYISLSNVQVLSQVPFTGTALIKF